MCTPVIAIAATELAVSVGATVLNHKSQNKASKGNETAANEAAAIDHQALSERLLEERIAAGQDTVAGERQATSAASTAKLAALGQGIAGNSVDQSEQGIEGDLGRYKDSVAQNLAVTTRQIGLQGQGVEAERKARIEGVPSANPFLTALTIGGQVLNTYTGLQASKPPRTN